MVLDLLHASDMIAMLPSRVAAAAIDLVALPSPIQVTGFDLHIAWHQRRAKDRTVQHVAALLEAALRWSRPVRAQSCGHVAGAMAVVNDGKARSPAKVRRLPCGPQLLLPTNTASPPKLGASAAP